jgi:hypothetical protein
MRVKVSVKVSYLEHPPIDSKSKGLGGTSALQVFSFLLMNQNLENRMNLIDTLTLPFYQ